MWVLVPLIGTPLYTKLTNGEVPFMLRNTATLTLLIMGLWALLAALGCSGGDSPVAPAGTTDYLAAANTGDTPNEGEREAADGTFSGVLTDSNGDPLAWTELYLDGELAGWTEEDGSFMIYGVEEEEEYSFEARIEDEVVYSTSVTPYNRTGQVYGDPDPEIDRGMVWGFVHDQFGPVDHALVIVTNQSENFGIDFTDENGFYEILDAPAGPGVVIAFAPEHAMAIDHLFVIPDGEIQKNLFLPKKIDFGIVGGQVVTGPIGHMRPIPHAKVEIQPLNDPNAPKVETFTNKFGIYRFVPVPPGNYQLTANAPSFNTGFQVRHIHIGRNLVNFHLEPAGCGGVEGQVTNPDGDPVPHALVRLIHPNPGNDNEPFIRWEFTNPMGFYRFDPVIPGQYHLDCGAPGFLPWVHEGPVPVFPDQFTVIDIELMPE